MSLGVFIDFTRAHGTCDIYLEIGCFDLSFLLLRPSALCSHLFRFSVNKHDDDDDDDDLSVFGVAYCLALHTFTSPAEQIIADASRGYRPSNAICF